MPFHDSEHFHIREGKRMDSVRIKNVCKFHVIVLGLRVSSVHEVCVTELEGNYLFIAVKHW